MLSIRCKLRLALLLSIALTSANLRAADEELGPWKQGKKLRLPSQASGITLSEDKKFVFALCSEKLRKDSGGIVAGFYEVYSLHGFAADSGKKILASGTSLMAGPMAQRGLRLAVADNFDKVTVYDLATSKKIGLIDPRSPNDSPPGSDKGIPAEFKDFGGGGRLSDIDFTPDAKVLLTIRKENTAWKKTGKGAFTSESFDRITFWDTDKGTKLGVLDCEDKTLYDGHMTLLPGRKQMLVKFSNGLRMIDLSTKKWGKTFYVKHLFAYAVSPDERKVVVTGRDQSIKVLDSDSFAVLSQFKEQSLNNLPFIEGTSFLEFGPTAQLVDDGKALKVLLNDFKTIVYRDAKTGMKIKTPASEDLKIPGGARVVAMSPDRRCVVTMAGTGGTECIIWTREVAEKK